MPHKVQFILSLGKNCSPANQARNMFSDQYPGHSISNQLLFRVLAKGRGEAFGRDDEESMVLFMERGLQIKQVDPTYGISGKFRTVIDPSNLALVTWHQQHPIEASLARYYGRDCVWQDTTHNATKYNYKTGPLSVVDAFGLNAPAGIYQVPQESHNLCLDRTRDLELDCPYATTCTDGGSAWPIMCQQMNHSHAEDTFHNDAGSDKK